jgi:hypothetical protein
MVLALSSRQNKRKSGQPFSDIPPEKGCSIFSGIVLRYKIGCIHEWLF